MELLSRSEHSTLSRIPQIKFPWAWSHGGVFSSNFWEERERETSCKKPVRTPDTFFFSSNESHMQYMNVYEAFWIRIGFTEELTICALVVSFLFQWTLMFDFPCGEENHGTCTVLYSCAPWLPWPWVFSAMVDKENVNNLALLPRGVDRWCVFNWISSGYEMFTIEVYIAPDGCFIGAVAPSV